MSPGRPRSSSEHGGVLRCHVARLRDDEVIRVAGLEVTGSDHAAVGRVKEAREGDFHLDRPMARDLYVPYSAVQEVTANRVVLNVPADQIGSMGWPETPLL